MLRHIADGAAQVLAVRRGDIDAALNLSPDQLDSLVKDANLKIVSAPSLDYMYMTLTNSAEMNAALGKKPARQAVAAAIDYDGIIKGLMGGHAIRPATFIPIGLGGSTEALTKEIGPKQDLAKARSSSPTRVCRTASPSSSRTARRRSAAPRTTWSPRRSSRTSRGSGSPRSSTRWTRPRSARRTRKGRRSPS